MALPAGRAGRGRSPSHARGRHSQRRLRYSGDLGGERVTSRLLGVQAQPEQPSAAGGVDQQVADLMGGNPLVACAWLTLHDVDRPTRPYGPAAPVESPHDDTDTDTRPSLVDVRRTPDLVANLSGHVPKRARGTTCA